MTLRNRVSPRNATAATSTIGAPNCGTPDVDVDCTDVVEIDETVMLDAVRGSSRLNHADAPFVKGVVNRTVPSLESVIENVAVLDS